MWITVFGHKHINSREGGIEVAVTQLVKYLSKDNSIAVIDRHMPWEHFPDEVPGSVRLLHADQPDKPWGTVIATMNATRIAASLPSDVVHVHAEGQCLFLPMLKAAGKKIVVTIHGLDWQRAKWGGKASDLIKYGERMAAEYADDIIVLSEDVQNYFHDVYGRTTHLIPNGIEVVRTDRSDRIERMGLEPGGYFLYLSRITSEKRPDLLVGAYEKLHTDTKLVFAGPVAEPEKETEWYKRAQKDPCILFAGFVEGETLAQLYENCRAFVLPSDIEGMSLALLEAMGYGCTCVISDIRENTAVAGRFGLPFKQGDADSLKQVLEGVLEEPYRRNETEAEYIAETYSWEKTAKLTEAVLKAAATH